MKKALWIVMAAALAVAVVAASAQTEVLSANAVGYIKKTLPAGGGWVAMSIPLDSMTNANLVFGETSVASEAPVNAEVAFWDPIGQEWLGGAKSSKGWGSYGNQIIQPGEGFFLKGDPAAVDVWDVTITGEVPADTQISRSVYGQNGFAALANPYPVDFVFGTSSIASNAPIDSEVSFWDVDAQSWEGGAKSSKGWGSYGDEVIQAGDGFFLKVPGSAMTWDADKPYTWP